MVANQGSATVTILDVADPSDIAQIRVGPMPYGVVTDGRHAFIAEFALGDIAVIDLSDNSLVKRFPVGAFPAGFGLAGNQGLANIDVGANPRGIAISPDGSAVYVNNVLDGTMSVIDADSFRVTNTIELTAIPLSAELLRGKEIFNSAAAPVLTTDNWIACASCHFDGGTDARTWLGFPDGPRNTPALFGVGETLPIHWSGDLNELQDVELTIRNIQFGTGLVSGEAHDSLGQAHAGLSPDLDALSAYMDSL